VSELVLGRLAELWRYPVKSMAGERLEEAEVSWFGVAGDRRWAFVREGVERSNFPWLTIRERSDMGSYRPRFADPSRPDDSRTLVRTPAGDELDEVDPALAAELGHGARVIKQGRGVFDALPLSLIATGSVTAVGELVGRPLDPRRFRPNLLVEAEAFAEDACVGRILRIGTMRMRVDLLDPRCAVVNVDPATSERDPEVLRAVAQERDSCLGVYGTPVEPGRVAVGDPVTVE
jgi:uncharacterized protein YcbX